MKKKKQKSNKRQEGGQKATGRKAEQKGRAERRGERVDAARYLCVLVSRRLSFLTP